MFKGSHKSFIMISGGIWLCVGLFLLPFGLHLLMETLQSFDSSYPLLEPLAQMLSSRENGIILIIAAGLFVGFMKGRTVLAKAANRLVKNILIQPSPVYLKNIYPPKYYILLGSMMFLGMSMNYFGVPSDVRGFIDVAIGSALINGAMVFFRLAQSLSQTKS